MTATLIAAPSVSHDFLSPLEQCIDFSPDSALVLVPQIFDRQNLVHEIHSKGICRGVMARLACGIVAPPAS